MRLTEGQSAPDFSVTDIYGNPVSLQDFAGKKVMLSFYRYASCPFCNLRVHKLTTLAPEWEAKGLSLLAVFQSPASSIHEHAGAELRPFSIIPDPEQRLYKRYGVGRSWLGLAKSAARVAELAEALNEGIRPGVPEAGGANRVPADFIIDASGKIVLAYYGKDIGDHLPIEDINRLLA